VQAVALEVIERDGQLPIVLAAVVRPLDLDARKGAVR
jgi:hypothetical protein